jgi:hypothetical protein
MSKSSAEMKEFMKRNCKSGYEYYETKFDELADILVENAAYTPFRFEGGIRGKDNIVSGAKFVVLDIDKSMLTDIEAHTLLNEYNHHIARTSDPDNEYKFRVLIELDALVDVDARMWKAFIEEIALELGLVIDDVPQSCIFFAFEGREVHTQLESSPLAVKPLLDRAAIRLRDKPKPARELPASNKEQLLADPRTTFEFAFQAEKGERSRLIYRALAYAIDIGADEEYIVNLGNEINDYLVDSMGKTRLDETLIKPALRRI